MIYYINVNKKRIVGRNNQISTRPLNLEYDVTEVIDFQFIDDNNQLQPLSPNTPGLTLAIGLKQNMPSYDLLALSHDYEIVNGQTLRFTVNTYTVNWLKKINKPNTEVFIEISQQSLESKKVWMRDYCYVWPRVWTAGLSPEEIQSKDYWTASETQEYVDNAIEGISGFVTEQQFEEGLATKQNVIDDENKLAYELLSGTPTIPTKTSDLDNDSGFITNSALVGYATESYVQGEVSGKQDAITNDNKLDYALISGAPTVPTSTSQLTNDSDFIDQTALETALSEKQDVIDDLNPIYATSVRMDIDPWDQGDPDYDVQFAVNYVHGEALAALSGLDEVSGALSGKQDVIDNNNKLDYALLSGTPNPTNIAIETIMSPNVNFTGKQIQKVDPTDATSGSITITFSNVNSIPNGYAPTCELHIASNGNISTITLPTGTVVVNMPETLEYIGNLAITYHVITFRAMKDIEGTVHVCANYNYKYEEDYL